MSAWRSLLRNSPGNHDTHAGDDVNLFFDSRTNSPVCVDMASVYDNFVFLSNKKILTFFSNYMLEITKVILTQE